jgi:hypothetical protein
MVITLDLLLLKDPERLSKVPFDWSRPHLICCCPPTPTVTLVGPHSTFVKPWQVLHGGLHVALVGL